MDVLADKEVGKTAAFDTHDNSIQKANHAVYRHKNTDATRKNSKIIVGGKSKVEYVPQNFGLDLVIIFLSLSSF